MLTPASAAQNSFEKTVLTGSALRIFSPEVLVNQQYYQSVSTLIGNATPQEFSEILALHKQKILASRFDDPQEVFNSLLPNIAMAIIREPSGQLKNPEQIGPVEFEKLEKLRTAENFDYWKDLTISYTSSQNFTSDLTHRPNSITLGYRQPFLLYLGNSESDFSEVQAARIRDLIDRSSSYELRTIDCRPERSQRSHDHLENKNLLHVLLEGKLTPNKEVIAGLLFSKELGNSSYSTFGHLQEWLSPQNERYNSVLWYSHRSPLHSAVLSGDIRNVQFALDHGAELRPSGSSYGGNAFAEAARFSHKPNFREIAEKLFAVAAAQDNTEKILGEKFTTSNEERYPIEYFGNYGNLDMVVALATRNAGIPQYKPGETIVSTTPVVLANYVAANGQFHPPVHTTKTERTTLWHEAGKESIRYIKQAVFNLDQGGRFYSAGAGIFDKAVAFLVEQGALDQSQVPKSEDPGFIEFAHLLRDAAMLERKTNPSFLKERAEFTSSFADCVRSLLA